jgi:hypothetical protein
VAVILLWETDFHPDWTESRRGLTRCGLRGWVGRASFRKLDQGTLVSAYHQYTTLARQSDEVDVYGNQYL